MKSIIAIYSDSRDPLVQLLRPISGITLVDVAEICNCIKKLPWPNVCTCTIDGIQPCPPGTLVFNRVFNLSGTAANEILEKAGIHQGWLHYHLGKLTDAAAIRVHDLGQPGISRSLLPLNAQWYLLKQLIPSVNVPDFIFGFNKFTPPIHHLKRPLLKSVWSFSAWGKENYISSSEISWNQFYVDAPNGVPVIISFIGNSFHTYFPRDSVAVPEDQVKVLVSACRTIFKTELGEVIIFVGGEGQLTFCAYSPFVGFSARRDEFQSDLVAYCGQFGE